MTSYRFPVLFLTRVSGDRPATPQNPPGQKPGAQSNCSRLHGHLGILRLSLRNFRVSCLLYLKDADTSIYFKKYEVYRILWHMLSVFHFTNILEVF